MALKISRRTVNRKSGSTSWSQFALLFLLLSCQSRRIIPGLPCFLQLPVAFLRLLSYIFFEFARLLPVIGSHVDHFTPEPWWHYAVKTARDGIIAHELWERLPVVQQYLTGTSEIALWILGLVASRLAEVRTPSFQQWGHAFEPLEAIVFLLGKGTVICVKLIGIASIHVVACYYFHSKPIMGRYLIIGALIYIIVVLVRVVDWRADSKGLPDPLAPRSMEEYFLVSRDQRPFYRHLVNDEALICYYTGL